MASAGGAGAAVPALLKDVHAWGHGEAVFFGVPYDAFGVDDEVVAVVFGVFGIEEDFDDVVFVGASGVGGRGVGEELVWILPFAHGGDVDELVVAADEEGGLGCGGFGQTLAGEEVGADAGL